MFLVSCDYFACCEWLDPRSILLVVSGLTVPFQFQTQFHSSFKLSFKPQFQTSLLLAGASADGRGFKR